MRMTDPVDPERLAALLDNRLDPKARNEVLRQLAGSEEWLEAFADAAAVLRETEEEDRRAVVLRPSGSSAAMAGSRGWFHSPAVRAALAAAIVIAVAIPVAQRMRGTGPLQPITFVAALSDVTPLPADWNSSPWSARRGENAPLTTAARAVRLGALLTDVELSIRARDSMSKVFAEEAASLLSDLPVSGPAVAAIRAVGDETSAPPAERLPRFFTARVMAASLVDRAPLDEGSWLEAARVAASRHDGAFFRDTQSSQSVKSTLDDADRALVDRASQTRADDSSTWAELERRLTELLAAHAH